MTRREHFADVAAGIAALAPDDPERIAALEHARGCARCAESLREGEALVHVVDAAPPPAPSPEAMRRMLLRISGAMSAPTVRVAPAAAVVVLSWAVAVLLARSRVHEPEAWMESAAILVLCLGLATLSRGRGLLVVGAALGASVCIAALTGTTGGLALAHGAKCTLIELVAAALPWGALGYSVVRSRAATSASTFAAMAAAGALAGQAALLLTCPERMHTPHLLVTHTGGVLLAALLGWGGALRLSHAREH